MKNILIALVFAPLMGCASAGMNATSSCTFSPAEKNGKYYTFITPGDAKCSFTLVAPVNKADDAKKFADAFKTMLGTAPSIEVEQK